MNGIRLEFSFKNCFLMSFAIQWKEKELVSFDALLYSSKLTKALFLHCKIHYLVHRVN